MCHMVIGGYKRGIIKMDLIVGALNIKNYLLFCCSFSFLFFSFLFSMTNIGALLILILSFLNNKSIMIFQMVKKHPFNKICWFRLWYQSKAI